MAGECVSCPAQLPTKRREGKKKGLGVFSVCVFHSMVFFLGRTDLKRGN